MMNSPMRLLIVLPLMLAACQSNPPPLDERLAQGEVCLTEPYVAPVGLVVEGRGQVVDWHFGAEIFNTPLGDVVGRIDPAGTFTISEGPVCWHVPPTSNNRIDHRWWRVRSDSGAEGWLEEYAGRTLISSARYRVQPLTDETPAITPGQPLAEPVSFSGSLQWTTADGPMEPRQKFHTVTFAERGYVDVAITSDDPGLLNADLFGETSTTACRVLGLTRVENLPVEIWGTTLRIGDQPVSHVWVEPGDHTFEVTLLYVPGAGPIDNPQNPTCPDTAYRLTVGPAGSEH